MRVLDNRKRPETGKFIKKKVKRKRGRSMKNFRGRKARRIKTIRARKIKNMLDFESSFG